MHHSMRTVSAQAMPVVTQASGRYIRCSKAKSKGLIVDVGCEDDKKADNQEANWRILPEQIKAGSQDYKDH